MLKALAENLGSTEPAVKLAITLFAAYALAAIYRTTFRRTPPATQYCYFVVCGVGFIFFNYGWDVYHSLISVAGAYIICKFIGGTVISVVIAFVFFIGHLFWGYYHTATNSYDILWTMPQCILVMRLIGLVTDLYDGQQKKVSSDCVETALKDRPSLLEIAAYTYFYGSFMVGPQYSLRRFRDFVRGHYEEPNVKGPVNTVIPSLQRLSLGVVYMAAHVYFFAYYPSEYFLTDEFKAEFILKKWITILIWFRLLLLRYQAVWLIAEGSCILSGLAYNGRNENGDILWDAVRNIRMVKFEFGSSLQSLIDSFNYNTNQWAAKYVFKRLRFLGNKNASHVITLLFLALWHGFFTGYLACFFYEFITVLGERKVWSAFSRNNCFITFSRTPEILFPLWLVKKLIITSVCALGLIPFALLSFDRWIQAYKNIYFLPWILCVILPPFLCWLSKTPLTGGTSKRRPKETHQG